MPRPRKFRMVCQLPPVEVFSAHGQGEAESVVLSVDEYECIRLIDHQGLSQAECAKHMQVSRATAQLIYESARKKLAAALVSGYDIRIEGGDFRFCDGNEEHCSCGGCVKESRAT